MRNKDETIVATADEDDQRRLEDDIAIQYMADGMVSHLDSCDGVPGTKTATSCTNSVDRNTKNCKAALSAGSNDQDLETARQQKEYVQAFITVAILETCSPTLGMGTITYITVSIRQATSIELVKRPILRPSPKPKLMRLCTYFISP